MHATTVLLKRLLHGITVYTSSICDIFCFKKISLQNIFIKKMSELFKIFWKTNVLLYKILKLSVTTTWFICNNNTLYNKMHFWKLRTRQIITIFRQLNDEKTKEKINSFSLIHLIQYYYISKNKLN